MAIGNVNLSRNGVDVEWRIEDFFSFTNTINGYFSPDFFLGGQEWNIRIYPNGDWLGCEPTGYIDLIFIRRFSGRAIMQDISLSIKTVTGEKDHEHSEKLEEWGKPGLGRQFRNFVSRSELLSRRSELVPNDVLTVVCSMKQTASAGSASNTASASNQCCHCKITFSADSLPSHRKKCMRRSIKCPDCLEVVVLRTWIDEHECQQERPEEFQTFEPKNNLICKHVEKIGII